MSDPGGTWPPAPLRWPEPALSDGVVALDPMTDEDVPRIVAGAADTAVQRWLPLPSPYTEASARQFLADQAAEAATGHGLTFAVRRAGSPQLCGSMTISFPARRGEGEIGYWISPDARREGLASRGIRVLARWAIDHVGLHRVEMLVQPGNVASQRACCRAGATEEGVRRHGLVMAGQGACHVVVYSLTPDDVGLTPTNTPCPDEHGVGSLRT